MTATTPPQKRPNATTEMYAELNASASHDNNIRAQTALSVTPPLANAGLSRRKCLQKAFELVYPSHSPCECLHEAYA